MCVYDFEVTLEQLPAGLLPIKLVRDVTDDNAPAKTIYTGQLDLSKGSGSTTLDPSDAGTWCQKTDEVPPQSFAVSECGGFAPASYAPGSYCAAEVLEWTFDGSNLKLVDRRALLNCCGERTVTVSKLTGVYVVTETDAPEKKGRCLCMCVFDLEVTLEKLMGGVIEIELVRDVTDDNAPPKTCTLASSTSPRARA